MQATWAGLFRVGTLPALVLAGVAALGSAGERWWAALGADAQRFWSHVFRALGVGLPGFTTSLVACAIACRSRRARRSLEGDSFGA